MIVRNQRTLAGLSALLLVTGCSSWFSGPQTITPVDVLSERLDGQELLTDATGATLYLFEPDQRGPVTCVQTCATNWPPLVYPAGGYFKPGKHVDRTLLGSTSDPAGGRVVTYNRWPLYTYAGDTNPGSLNGQATNLNGGIWYAMTVSGTPL